MAPLECHLAKALLDVGSWPAAVPQLPGPAGRSNRSGRSPWRQGAPSPAPDWPLRFSGRGPRQRSQPHRAPLDVSGLDGRPAKEIQLGFSSISTWSRSLPLRSRRSVGPHKAGVPAQGSGVQQIEASSVGLNEFGIDISGPIDSYVSLEG